MARLCLFLPPIVVLSLLAGCQRTHEAAYGRADFGEAVRRNVEAQIVNPAAPGEVGPAALDGDRAAIAIGRYKVDQVEEPEPLSTTTVGGD